jgi:chromosome segregation ATPase
LEKEEYKSNKAAKIKENILLQNKQEKEEEERKEKKIIEEIIIKKEMIEEEKKLVIQKENEIKKYEKIIEEKQQTHVQKYSELKKGIDTLHSEIEELKELEKDISNELYKIDIIKLDERKNEINSQLDSNEKKDEIISKYSIYKKELKNKTNEINNLKIKLSSNEEELKNYYKDINLAIKSTFKNYEIDLFKNDKSIKISKNGIE